MNKPELTPERLDALLTPPRRDRIIWTAPAIGQRIGRSEDYVRKVLAKMDGTPIRCMGRRLYAFEDDLFAFMRDQAA